MRKFKSDFIAEAVQRGFLHQCTDLDGLDALMAEGRPVAGYVGYDCTAPSLHVGSLVSIMLLRLLQRTGHRPIVLMGGGTTQVGDPSGKDEQRQLLSKEDIARNMMGIKSVFERFLVFGKGKTDALMVDNADWLDKLRYIDVLREVGRHFSVNRMLTFDSVKLRLEREQPLSFLEFNYMVLQAYDFLELARRYDCLLQMGGSDQWGNIVSGVELARRIDQRTIYGLTTPLITLASGAKMGKTASGAVWLNADRVAPYDYWQFWRNVDDADVGRFLRLFTELPAAEIKRLERLAGVDLNEAKKVLATEATGLAHGREAAEAAAETARQTFEEGETSAGLPTVTIRAADLDADGGMASYSLVVKVDPSLSNSAARRLIKGGGVRIQGNLITDELHRITSDTADSSGSISVQLGKKKHVIAKYPLPPGRERAG